MYLIPVAYALLYPEVCSALGPAASLLLFPPSTSMHSYHIIDLCCSCEQVKKHKFGSRFVLSACRLSDQVLLRCLRSGLAWTSLPWDTAGKMEGCYCLKPAHVVKRVEKGKQKGADTRLQENNTSGKCVKVATTSGVTNV